MDARRAVAAAKRAEDPQAEKTARAAVHEAKVALGERGPVWWDDGAPDYTRKLIENTPYAPCPGVRTIRPGGPGGDS